MNNETSTNELIEKLLSDEELKSKLLNLINYIENLSYNNTRFNLLSFNQKLLASYLILTNQTKDLNYLNSLIYRFKIPDINEFLTEDYIGEQAQYYRVGTKHGEYLRELFNPDKSYYEAIYSGATGIGKSTSARIALFYNLHRINCLRNPQITIGGDSIAPIYCLTGDTKIYTLSHGIKYIKDLVNEEYIYTYSYDIKNNKLTYGKVYDVKFTRRDKVYKIGILDKYGNISFIRATSDHKFLLTNNIYEKVSNLKIGDNLKSFYFDTISDKEIKEIYNKMKISKNTRLKMKNINLQEDYNKRLILRKKEKIQRTKSGENDYHSIISIEYDGEEDVYDMSVSKYHNFAICDTKNNIIISHNCQMIGLTKDMARTSMIMPFLKIIKNCKYYTELSRREFKSLNKYYDTHNDGLIPYVDYGTEIWFPNQICVRSGSNLTDTLSKDLFGIYCLTGDTKIPLLNGEIYTIKDLVNKTNFKVFSYDVLNNKYVEGNAHSVRLTRKNARIIKINFTNGGYVKLTPDHKVLLYSGIYKQAQDLIKGDSIKSLYLSENPEYRFCCENVNKKSHSGKFELYKYLAYSNLQKPENFNNERLVVHHKDSNPSNNELSNLEIMKISDHKRYHAKLKFKENPEFYNYFKQKGFEATCGKDWKNTPGLLEQRQKWAQDMRYRLDIKQKKRVKDRCKLIPIELLESTAKKYDTIDQSFISSKLNCGYRHIQYLINKYYCNIYEFCIYNNITLNKNTKRIYSLYKNRGWMYTTPENTPERLGGLLKLPKKDNEYNHIVESIEDAGYEDVYNMEVDNYHNFLILDNVISKRITRANTEENYLGGIYIHNCEEADFKQTINGYGSLELYNLLKDRMQSRFFNKYNYRSRYLLAVLISSVTHDNAPISIYMRDIENESNRALIFRYSRWEIFPPKTDKYFYVQVGNNAHPHRLFEDPKDLLLIDTGQYKAPPSCKLLKIPAEESYLENFRKDLEKSIQNIAGIATSNDLHPFNDFSKCQDSLLIPELQLKSNYTDPEDQPLWKQLPLDELFIPVMTDNDMVKQKYKFKRYPTAPRYIGIDPAKSHIAGFSVAHKEIGDDGRSILVFDFMAEIVTDTQIKMQAVDDLAKDINEIFGAQVKCIAMDTYDARSMQVLKLYYEPKNTDVRFISVDRDIAGYSLLSSCILEGLIKWGKCPRNEEMLGGIYYNNNKPYASDLICDGRKDLPDSVCRAVVASMHYHTEDVPINSYKNYKLLNEFSKNLQVKSSVESLISKLGDDFKVYKE